MRLLFSSSIWVKNCSNLMKFSSLPSALSPLSSHSQIFMFALLAAVAHTCTHARNWNLGGGFICVLKSQHIKRPFITAVIGLLGEHSQEPLHSRLLKIDDRSWEEMVESLRFILEVDAVVAFTHNGIRLYERKSLKRLADVGKVVYVAGGRTPCRFLLC